MEIIMKIKFYGSSHGLPEADRFCTSVLIEASGRYYFVDAGAPISNLLVRDEIKFKDVKAFFLTHLHGDHISGLPHFLDLASWYYTDADPLIFTPNTSLKRAVDSWLETVKCEGSFRYSITEEGAIYSDGTIEVTAYETVHDKCVEPGRERRSFAYKITELSSGKKCLFTGDLTDSMTDFPSTAFEEEFDLIVTEGAHSRVDENAHILKKCKTKRMLIGHVNPHENTPDVMRRLVQSLSFPVSTAYDDLILDL